MEQQLEELRQTNAHGQALLQQQGFPIASFPQWNSGCPSTHPGGRQECFDELLDPTERIQNLIKKYNNGQL